jgi:hypothetical protein
MAGGKRESAGAGTLLDRRLPEWHFREVHRRRIQATPQEAIEIALALRVRDLPLSAVLMALRMAPAALAARRRPSGLDRPLFEVFRRLGFVELGRSDEEIVLGAAGKFWRLRENLEPLSDPEDFERFDAPGFAKGAMNLRAAATDGGTELVTETRVWTTDEAARRAFRLYWLPVRVGGELIRRELLAAVARSAGSG